MKKKQKMPLEAVVAITIGIIFSTLFAVTAIGDDQGEMEKPSDIKADAVTVAPSATESYPVEEHQLRRHRRSVHLPVAVKRKASNGRALRCSCGCRCKYGPRYMLPGKPIPANADTHKQQRNGGLGCRPMQRLNLRDPSCQNRHQ